MVVLALLSLATSVVPIASSDPAWSTPMEIHGQVRDSGGALIEQLALFNPLPAEASGACSAVGAGQTTTSRGTPGQTDVTLSGPRGVTLWTFTVVRPSVSTGLRASGIEIRDVKYRGKLLLARANTPIVNGKWDGDICGPYRFWQYQEGMFNCSLGTDLAAGIRTCAGAPTTIIETGSDTGTYRGVGLFSAADGVDLVSELEAGWERYVIRYKFKPDGTLQARVGFSQVDNACSCPARQRHAYMRFDVDMVTANNNWIRRHDASGWTGYTTETSELRTGQSWKIENSLSHEFYYLFAGVGDGTADAYGKSDVWILSNNTPSELDDGVNCTLCATSSADIDSLLTGQDIGSTADLVLWYAVHHTLGGSPNYLGPDFVADDTLFANGFE